jgi:hypothetical protein
LPRVAAAVGMSDMGAAAVLAVASVLNGGEPVAPSKVRAPVGAPPSCKEFCSVAADCKSEVALLELDDALSAGNKPGVNVGPGGEGQIDDATVNSEAAVGL